MDLFMLLWYTFLEKNLTVEKGAGDRNVIDILCV
jgi:hypothetical protein